MRFLTPIILFASAGFVFWYNQRGGDDVLIFPFITSLWPDAAGDPEKLSRATIALISTVASALLVKDLWITARNRRAED